MDRTTLLTQWHDADSKGLWAAPWNRVLSGLTADQAAWKPSPQRHSIWQIVNHICFWREHELRSLAGRKPDEAEVTLRNWEEPREFGEAGWSAAQARFRESYRQMAEAIRNEKNPLDRLCFVMPHDCYHVGQMMYLRSMQGLPSVE